MVLRAHFLLLLLIPFASFGSTPVSSHGEFSTPNFSGSHLADTIFNPYLFELKLKENQLRNNYVETNINDEFFDLSEFVSTKLYLGLSCPDDSFSEKYTYLRFLNRLQVLSYLFQSLREHEYSMKKLDFKESCHINWSHFIKDCKPKSKEMKHFLMNASEAFKSLEPLNITFKKGIDSLREDWIDSSNNSNATLSQLQLARYCEQHNCPRLDPSNLNKPMELACTQEKNLFLGVCNENDSLYGLSYIPETYPLLISSSGLRGVDIDGYGAGCVKRFASQNKNLEKRAYLLQNIFSVLYEYNLEQFPQNPQGKLFTLGALKEFSDKGLMAIFKRPDTVSPKKKKLKVVGRILNPEFEKIELPIFIKKKKIKKVVKPNIQKIPEKPIVRKSSFLISCEVREQFELDNVSIDMEKFKLDHIFTLSEKEKLLPVVKQFSTNKALKSMVKLDALGSPKAPLPLKFIKFLIDEKMNQNLFTINLVLGSEFYVINDIDKNIKDPNLIELSFNSSSLSWELKVLGPSTSLPE